MKALLIVLLCTGPMLAAQDPIILKNPSFEDTPAYSSSPIGWQSCGFDEETPPDVHPGKNGRDPLFGVTQTPYEGETYLGMATRDNNTWESVSSKLDAPFQKGIAYQFSLFLCQSAPKPVHLQRSQLRRSGHSAHLGRRRPAPTSNCWLSRRLSITASGGSTPLPSCLKTIGK